MIAPVAPPLDGTLRFVRYGFMPNRLRYCGGDDDRTLFEQGVAGVTDLGLRELLARFTGALPYLKLIASANRIADPFDARVVEAYWIGNELLDRVQVRQLYDALIDRFGKQLQGRTRDLVIGKAPAGAHPHHSFHVLDVHSRLGDLPQTVATLDSCRISWARVVEVDGSELVIDREPVALQAGRLVLAAPRRERALRQVEGRGFADAARPGDWVSLHWGWVCETLTDRQQRTLERYTRHHLTIANQTI